MIRLVKKIFFFIWSQKRNLFFLFLFVVLFFFLRFPWNDLLTKKAQDFQKKSSSSMKIDFEKLDFRFIPPGVEFKELVFGYKRKNLLLDSLRVGLGLKELLAFNKAWSVKAKKDHSVLSVVFWKKDKIFKEISEDRPLSIYFIKGESPSLNLKDLSELFPSIKLSGFLNLFFNYNGSLERMEKAKGYVRIEGKEISLSQTFIQTPLGPLNFPSIQWKEGELLARLKEGELLFEKINLGVFSDDFTVKMKGSLSLLFSSGQLRFPSYNIQLQIDMDKNFQMSLLDLMFSGQKEDKGSFFRYKVRLIGQGKQVPKIEKLSEF